MSKFENEAWLNTMRTTADPAADTVVKKLFEEGNAGYFGKLMASVSANNEPVAEHLPGYVKEYFAHTATLPTWADKKLMHRGHMFFKEHTTNIFTLLGLLSLPFCYAASDGAQVLYLSQRIKKDTFKRLEETGQFVAEVMQPDAFDPEGHGIRTIQKVRLMHAAMRYHISKSGKWQDEWGAPINQEDMSGTNLSFSFIILRGLRQIGCSLNHDDAHAYLHLWNVIGYMMGVSEELLAPGEKEAFALGSMIAHRHFKPSPVSRELVSSLLECLQSVAPYNKIKGFAPTFMRFLLGEEVANMLGLPPSNWTRTLITALKAANAVRSISDHTHDEAPAWLDQLLKNKHKTEFAMPLGIQK